jgi:hypothetical protein
MSDIKTLHLLQRPTCRFSPNYPPYTQGKTSPVFWGMLPSILPIPDSTFEALLELSTLGIRNGHRFRGRCPSARTLARLRIAGRVAAPVARLATGWGGYPFAGRVSHPLDDLPNFMNSSHDSLPSDQPFLVALNGLCPKTLEPYFRLRLKVAAVSDSPRRSGPWIAKSSPKSTSDPPAKPKALRVAPDQILAAPLPKEQVWTTISRSIAGGGPELNRTIERPTHV